VRKPNKCANCDRLDAWYFLGDRGAFCRVCAIVVSKEGFNKIFHKFYEKNGRSYLMKGEKYGGYSRV
jgi:hypothetical protein